MHLFIVLRNLYKMPWRISYRSHSNTGASPFSFNTKLINCTFRTHGSQYCWLGMTNRMECTVLHENQFNLADHCTSNNGRRTMKAMVRITRKSPTCQAGRPPLLPHSTGFPTPCSPQLPLPVPTLLDCQPCHL